MATAFFLDLLKFSTSNLKELCPYLNLSVLGSKLDIAMQINAHYEPTACHTVNPPRSEFDRSMKIIQAEIGKVGRYILVLNFVCDLVTC